jgi:hypothetical protein
MERKYKFAIISNDTVKLFNNSALKGSLSTDVFLEDVAISFDKNGCLHIRANRIEYDFYCPSDGCKVFEENWKSQPDPKCIKEGKRHFWSTDKEKYVDYGWVRSTRRTPVEYIKTHFTIEKYD